MEEVRAKYYRELKRFISIPDKFGGVGESGTNISLLCHFATSCTDSGIFKSIIERNAHSYSVVYRKVSAGRRHGVVMALSCFFCQAENLFSRLGKVVGHFKEWVVLGMVDIDALTETKLNQVSHWEENFKAIKAKGRDAEKLPSTIKIDCITVNTMPTKNAIDDLVQRLYDALLNSLRKVLMSGVRWYGPHRSLF